MCQPLNTSAEGKHGGWLGRLTMGHAAMRDVEMNEGEDMQVFQGGTDGRGWLSVSESARPF